LLHNAFQGAWLYLDVTLDGLKGALHPACDDGEAAGPVDGEESGRPVEVHADVGDVVGPLGHGAAG